MRARVLARHKTVTYPKSTARTRTFLWFAHTAGTRCDGKIVGAWRNRNHRDRDEELPNLVADVNLNNEIVISFQRAGFVLYEFVFVYQSLVLDFYAPREAEHN